jgi:NAD(P)-dependent dehydrogenase (short-subunit alcohol dehydrogenase family)
MSGKSEKVIWITGASSFASARDQGALQQLAKLDSNIVALPCDITDQASLEAAFDQIAKTSSYLDQVILNAGNCEYLDFPNPDWPAVRRVMEINFFGTVNCVQQALPLLRRSKNEAYGASKAALQYFFDSLRLDLAAESIDVTIVNPGFVDTPLTQKNDFPMPFLMDVEQAATRIIRNIEARPRHYSFPLRLSLSLAFSKLMPGRWQKMVAPRSDYTKTESKQGAGE